MFLLLAALPALADVAPPNEDGCEGLSAGDVCVDDAGDKATCATRTCTRLDYSNTDSGVPTTVEYECLLCDGDKKGGCATVPSAPLGAAALGIFLALPLVFRRKGPSAS